MMQFIMDFLCSDVAIPAGASLMVYAIGLLSQSKAYKSARNSTGRFAFRLGALLSMAAESKLGRIIWDPIETVITDFVLFFAERLASGLRSDNVSKLEAQVERLKGVGSVFQREAIESKLDILKDPVDKRVIDHLEKLNASSSNDKLKA